MHGESAVRAPHFAPRKLWRVRPAAAEDSDDRIASAKVRRGCRVPERPKVFDLPERIAEDESAAERPGEFNPENGTALQPPVPEVPSSRLGL